MTRHREDQLRALIDQLLDDEAAPVDMFAEFDVAMNGFLADSGAPPDSVGMTTRRLACQYLLTTNDTTAMTHFLVGVLTGVRLARAGRA